MNKSVYIALGTNLGNRQDNLSRACELLQHMAGQILSYSAAYETTPVGFESTDLFLNSVVELETELEPQDLLKILRQIEEQMGRVRTRSTGYESRIIDLDMIDYKGILLNSSELILPHPRMHQRKFVLVPLSEISPDWRHPELNISLKELLNRLKSDENITKSVYMKV